MKTLIALIAALFASSAFADEKCALHQIASLDMKQLSDGRVVVPVTIDGSQQMMSLSVSAPVSFLYEEFGSVHHIPVAKMLNATAYGAAMASTTPIYVVPEFSIGSAHSKNVQFAKYPRPPGVSDGLVGDLSLDLLATFDVDLDFRNNKLNLFSRDHCKGKVVYWADFYTSLPFTTDHSGHPNFKMQLDGKELSVDFNMHRMRSAMGMLTAKRIFGIDESTPGLMPVTDSRTGRLSGYHYMFKSLGLGGLTIGNPDVFLYPQQAECSTAADYQGLKVVRCFGTSEMDIGLMEIKQLHLYFAFAEKTLYLTAADAHH